MLHLASESILLRTVALCLFCFKQSPSSLLLLLLSLLFLLLLLLLLFLLLLLSLLLLLFLLLLLLLLFLLLLLLLLATLGALRFGDVKMKEKEQGEKGGIKEANRGDGGG